MNPGRDSLAKYVPPRLTGARLARQWGAIEARAGAARRRWRAALPVGFAFAAEWEGEPEALGGKGCVPTRRGPRPRRRKDRSADAYVLSLRNVMA